MKKFVFVLVAAFAAVSVNAQELTIIHFNDTHSHVDPQRAGEHKGLGGVIEQAVYIDSVRCADGKRNVLLLHAGDFSQGTSYFTELGGDMEIDVANALGFDVMALGNHEFDNGPVELARRLKNLKAKVVCANYDFAGTALDGLVDPYVIVRKAGKKIGIIGLLPNIHEVVDVRLVADLIYQDPVSVINPIAEFLKNEKKCDLVLCLSHLGYEMDTEIASYLSNVDLIVGGHSHTDLKEIKTVAGRDGKEVQIVQNWKWGLAAANLKITF